MIKVLLIFILFNLVQSQDLCTNFLIDDNEIILNAELLTTIDDNDYKYQDIINCLDDGGIFNIQIEEFEPEDTLEITKGITIKSSLSDEQEAKINCNDNNELFIINSENEVTFIKVKIEDCRLENGIFQIVSNSTLNIQESSFKNVESDGSLITMEEDSALILDNINFEENTISNSAGLIKADKKCNIRIESSNVINSNGDSSLIRIEEGTIIVIEDTVFTNNTIKDSGAILKADMSQNDNTLEININIINSYFIENFADGNIGGVLYISGEKVTCNISDSSFLRNKASFEAGALFICEGASITIIESVFIDNLSYEGGGGAIFAEGNDINTYIDISECIFSSNKAENLMGTGGAIQINGIFLYCIISNNTIFTYNMASLDGGAFYAGKMATSEIINSTFSRNKAESAGGGAAITVDSSREYSTNTVSFINCTFSDNEAISSRGGAAIYGGGIGTIIYIYGGTYTNNRCTEGSGGVFRLFSGPRLTIQDYATFKFNYGFWGGMLFAENDITVKIDNAYVIGNIAEYLGGAIYTTGDVDLTINYVQFINNSAADGGAIKIKNYFDTDDEESTIAINNSFFHNNSICYDHNKDEFTNNGCFGGTITLEGSGVNANIQYCTFTENKGGYGGVIFTYWPKRLWVFYSSFDQNRGDRGGAIGIIMYNPIYYDFSVKVTHDTFTNNYASEGGAIHCSSSASTILGYLVPDIFNTSFINNEAERRGGAIYAEESNFSAVDCTFNSNAQGDKIESNSSSGGGAVTVDKNSIFTLNGVTFNNNTSKEDGGAISSTNSHLIMDYVSFIGNIADLYGGAISHIMTFYTDLSDDYFFTCTHCNFEQNQAKGRGGAIFFKSDLNSTEEYNYAMINSFQFTENVGLNGGAIFSKRHEKIKLCCNCSSDSITPITLGEFQSLENIMVSCGASFNNNAHSDGGYGMDLATIPKTPFTIPDVLNEPIYDFASDTYMKEIQFCFKDAFGQNVTKSDMLVLFEEVPRDFYALSGQRETQVDENGFANFTGTRVTAPASDEPYIINVDFIINDEILMESESLQIYVRNCNIGEKLIDVNRTICQACEMNEYNFDPTKNTCNSPCPSNAYCLKYGATVTPEEGYWHSSSFSTQIHECLIKEACNSNNRAFELAEIAYLKSQSNDDIKYYLFNDTKYNQCSKGYSGRLCAHCIVGYAKANDKCESCFDIVAYTVICIILQYLVLIGIIVYFIKNVLDLLIKLEFNKKLSEKSNFLDIEMENMSGGLSSQSEVTIKKALSKEMSNTALRSEEIQVRTDSEYVHNNHPFSVEPMQNETKLTNEEKTYRVYTMLKSKLKDSNSNVEIEKIQKVNCNVKPFSLANPVSEVLKIMINYLQVTSIAFMINVNWTETLSTVFVIEEIVSSYTASSGSAHFSFECTLQDSCKNKRLITMLLNILMPFVYFIIIAIGWIIYLKVKNKPFSLLKNRLLLTGLSVLYVSYIGVTRNLWRFFFCAPIDETSHPDYDPVLTPNTKLYWLEDTDRECFTYGHLAIVSIVVMPGLLIYTMGFPAFIVLKLRNSADKREDEEFVSTYGFLYKAYNIKFSYWEAVILARKALVAAIVVFSYELGGNLQGILICVVLFNAFAFQLIFMPFTKEYPRLNCLEVLSLSSSILTYAIGLVLNDFRTNQSARMFLSVFLVFVVICTVGRMAFDMVIFSEDFFDMKLLENKVLKYSELEKLTPIQKVYTLCSFYGSIARDKIFNTVSIFKYSTRSKSMLQN